MTMLFAAVLAVAGCGSEGDSDDSLKPENLRLPAMTLVCGGEEVPDGGAYDFGLVESGETPGVECRIYNNDGQADLQIFYLGFAGAGASPFSIDDEGTVEYIAPNGFTTFTLGYSPVEETGVRSELVYIINNDAGEGGFAFRVMGTCASPKKQPDVELTVNGRSGEDEISALSLAPDGSLYVAGRGSNLVNGSYSDWWLKKYSPDGTELEFNGNLTLAADECGDGTSPCTVSGSDMVYNGLINGGLPVDFTASIAVDGSGNVYVAGTGTRLVGASSGVDCWIKKFSSDGEELTAGWDKKLDGLTGTAGYNDRASGVAVDGENNVYVVGYSASSSGSVSDWWIKKFAPNGDEIAVPFYTTLHGEAVKFNYATAIAVDGDGYIYAAGYAKGLLRYPAVSFDDSSMKDWWIRKLDPDTGFEVWLYTYGTDESGDDKKDDQLISIAMDGAGGVFLAGSGDGDFMIKRLFTASGTEDASWNRVFSCAGGFSEATAISVADDGSVFVAGYGFDLAASSSGDDWWIKKFNPSGAEDAVLWDLMLDYDGGGDRPSGMVVTDDYLYVAGWVENVPFYNDWWLMRFTR